jgi:hypothetical protein
LGVAFLYLIVMTGPLPFKAAWWQSGQMAADSCHRRSRIADWLVREWNMMDWLGAEGGFVSIASEWLVLRLDVSGVVREAQIISD